MFFFSEDLSKSEDRDDMKKEGEDGKGVKKDDPEVNSAFISYLTHFLLSVLSNKF